MFNKHKNPRKKATRRKVSSVTGAGAPTSSSLLPGAIAGSSCSQTSTSHAVSDSPALNYEVSQQQNDYPVTSPATGDDHVAATAGDAAVQSPALPAAGVPMGSDQACEASMTATVWEHGPVPPAAGVTAISNESSDAAVQSPALPAAGVPMGSDQACEASMTATVWEHGPVPPAAGVTAISNESSDAAVQSPALPAAASGCCTFERILVNPGAMPLPGAPGEINASPLDVGQTWMTVVSPENRHINAPDGRSATPIVPLRPATPQPELESSPQDTYCQFATPFRRCSTQQPSTSTEDQQRQTLDNRSGTGSTILRTPSIDASFASSEVTEDDVSAKSLQSPISSGHTNPESQGTQRTSLRAPRGLFKSFVAVTTRNKRRRCKTGSSSFNAERERRKRKKKIYDATKHSILQRKKERYENSPGFVDRVTQRVSSKYGFSPRYRQIRLRRSANRYACDSPLRKRIKGGAVVTQKKRRLSQPAIDKERQLDNDRYCKNDDRRQALIRSIKNKYHTQSPFKRRIQQRARSCYWRMKALMKRSGSDNRTESARNSQESRNCASRSSGANESTERLYVAELQKLMRKRNHLMHLLKRKKRRIQLHNQPVLPVAKKGTAEYRRGNFTRWHRYKVNQIAATALIPASDGSQVDRVTLQEVKTKASQLLDVVLAWRRNRQGDLYANVGAIARMVARIEEEISDGEDGDGVEQLADAYCGRQFHVRYCEPVTCDKSVEVYEPAGKLLSMDDVSVNENTLVRMCDSRCQIPAQKTWASILHAKLGSLDPELKIERLLGIIGALDVCRKCNSIRISCSGPSECTNIFATLLQLRVHYSYLRVVLRQLYRVREFAMELNLIELLLDSGTYTHLLQYRETIQAKERQQASPETTEVETSSSVSDAGVLEKFGTLIAACKQGWLDNMQVHECCSCLRLVGAKSLKLLARDSAKVTDNHLLLDIVDYYEKDRRTSLSEVQLCFTCWRKLSGKNPIKPRFCYKNEIWPDKVPPQLKQLNPYELRLCSLATNCQHIVKLKPYRYRGPTSTLARGIKGISVHLPLPLGSIKAVEDILTTGTRLPNMENFAIYVDGLPNVTTRTVFRSVVDMTSVMSALYWLQKNNVLYMSPKVVISDAFLLRELNIFVDRQTVMCDDIIEDVFQSVAANNEGSEDRNGAACNTACAAANHPVSDGSTAGQRDSRAKKRISFFDPPLATSTEQSDLLSGITEEDSREQASVSHPVEQSVRQASVFQPVEQSLMQASVSQPVEQSVRQASVSQPVEQSVRQASVSQPVEQSVRQASTTVSGNAIAEIVASKEYPIPWDVPYPEVSEGQLMDDNTTLAHVPRRTMLENYSVIDVDKSLPNKKDLELFMSKPIIAKPLSWNDPLLDLACFPHLFPLGRNGIFHPRPDPVPVALFLDNRINLSDPRFRRDQTWVLNCAVRKDLMALDGSIHTVLNCGKFGKNVTAGQLKSDISAIRDLNALERCINTLLGNIVASPGYFFRLEKNVEAVLEDKGAAHWFLTLSCGEYKNEDFREFLILRNTDVVNAERADIRHLLSLDPISVSLHFHTRFMEFWDTVIMNPEGPLGKVKFFFIRKEYQQRGAPHMHCMLWMEDAPRLEKDGSNTDVVLEFIEQYVTCSLPDPVSSPVLNSLVQSCQMHRCTESCTQKIRKQGKFIRNQCRYGFPRDQCDQGLVNSLHDVQASRVGGRKRLRLYNLPRKMSEVYVNDYNAALLYLWQSNMDIQFIGDDSLVVNKYTNKYICKTEMQKPSDVADVIDSGLSAFGMMKKLGCKMLASRQLGIFEAADKVNRLPMYRMNLTVKQSPFYMPENDRRRLKTKSKLAELPDDSIDVFSRNFAHDYYPKRPDELERMSAYDVLTRYDTCTQPGPIQKQSSLYVKELNTVFTVRKQPAVIKIFKPSRNDAQAVENVSFTMLSLFKPFRGIGELLEDRDGNRFNTYRESYNYWAEELEGMQEFAASRQRLEAAVAWSEEVQRKALEAMAKEAEEREEQQVEEACEAAALEMDVELCEQSARLKSALSQGLLDTEYTQLNGGQRKAFDMVKEAVDSLAVAKAGNAIDGCGALRLFVSGVGGTGKSFLIRALRNYVEFRYTNDDGPAVLVAAPTGIAAINIDGITIHKLLKLPVQKSAVSFQPFTKLQSNDAKLLKTVFRNVKLLILDEVSMFSNLTLLYIHQRLVEVCDFDDRHGIVPFANVNILLLGDLLQLPPVSGSHVFAPTSRRLIMKNMAVMGANLNLWKSFSFVELTENMRQRDDAAYAQMLDRIRLGNPTTDDIAALESRLICTPEDSMDESKVWIQKGVQQLLDLSRDDPQVLCLMPRIKDVDEFNLQALNTLGLQTVLCLAEDKFDSAAGKKKGKSRRKQPNTANAVKRKTADTGGLEEELIVARGARVMLRRNLDPTKKLVNGSIGVIEQLVFNDARNCVTALHVKFQDVPEIISITRVSVKYTIGNRLFVMRTQFPVTLAYAITVHKCQGLSLESAIADIGSTVFADGMSYVVLSRVKRLRSLYLLRFDPGCLKCDGRAVKAYDALRKAAGIPKALTKFNCNPMMKKYEKKVTVSGEAQKAQLAEQVEMRELAANIAKRPSSVRLVTDVPSKKQRRQGPQEILTTGEYVKFRNPDGHACFANSAIQCLMRCHEVRSRIIDRTSDSIFTECLSEVCLALAGNRAEPFSLDLLREAFGQQSQFSLARAMDCDPVEFLQSLMEKLPTSVSDLFNFGFTIEGHCPNRNCKQYNLLESATDCFVAMATSIDHNNFTVKHLFPEKYQQRVTCIHCSSENYRFPCRKSFFFNSSQRYLILHVPIVDFGAHDAANSQPINKALLGFTNDSVRLFNIKWNLLGFVQVSGNWHPQAQRRGIHYIAFLRHRNQEWISLSDECQHLLAKRPPCRHGVLYFLEKDNS